MSEVSGKTSIVSSMEKHYLKEAMCSGEYKFLLTRV